MVIWQNFNAEVGCNACMSSPIFVAGGKSIGLGKWAENLSIFQMIYQVCAISFNITHCMKHREVFPFVYIKA